MQLDNITPIPAAATVLRGPSQHRMLAVTAKATFSFADGPPKIEQDSPEPLRGVDTPTSLGLLPADTTPRLDAAFEVLCLGCAQARTGDKVRQQVVTLTVGSTTRQLVVSGDRRWRVGLGSTEISRPEAFEKMPLTWDRAFGGHCDVYLDAASPLEVSHPLNRIGRGFDPLPFADALQRKLRLPTGWPQFRQERQLPNVERPDQLVGAWRDAPEPAGWSTIPHHLGMAQLSAMRDEPCTLQTLAYRAHPDWVGERPELGAGISMTGLTSEGHTAFSLPQLRIFVDLAEGTCELVPQMLVLLPEQRRLSLLFRTVVVLAHRSPSTARRARLRAESGWCAPGTTVRAEVTS